jgi:hypothetical protein
MYTEKLDINDIQSEKLSKYEGTKVYAQNKVRDSSLGIHSMLNMSFRDNKWR